LCRIIVGQPLLAVPSTFSVANPDSQEWLSYKTAHGKYGCGPAFSTNLRRPSITAGRVKTLRAVEAALDRLEGSPSLTGKPMWMPILNV